MRKRQTRPGPPKHRDPNWRLLRAKGHGTEPDRTKYSRKAKHRKDPRQDDRGSFLLGAKTKLRSFG